MTDNLDMIEKKENVLLGTLGALLFALAGGIVWFLMYQIGFLAGISGLVGVICAVKGYKLFAKKESLLGVIISIVAAVIVMVIAWYFCLSMDVYDVFKEWYAAGEVDAPLTFTEALLGAHIFLQEGEILDAYLRDLAMGLLLCVVGAFGVVRDTLRRIKAEKEAPAPQSDFPEAAPQEETPSL